VLLGAGFLLAQARERVHVPSFALVGAGSYVAWLGYDALGPDLYHGGAQLAASDLAALGSTAAVASFPFDATFGGHPVAAGTVVALLGLRLHPTFGPRFSSCFAAMIVLQALLVAVEVTDLHVPAATHGYFQVFSEFSKFHQVPGNVFWHLATTGASLVGVLGLAFHWGLSHGKTATKGTTKDTTAAVGGPLLATALCWIVVRYTVPDDDVAYACVGLVYLLGRVAWALELGAGGALGLVVLGALAQEASHYAFGEMTYMASYAGEAASKGSGAEHWLAAAGTFALHNVWLLPFEVRAAINALTAAVVPATA
jgi:hypothetical protein